MLTTPDHQKASNLIYQHVPYKSARYMSGTETCMLKVVGYQLESTPNHDLHLTMGGNHHFHAFTKNKIGLRAPSVGKNVFFFMDPIGS